MSNYTDVAKKWAFVKAEVLRHHERILPLINEIKDWIDSDDREREDELWGGDRGYLP